MTPAAHRAALRHLRAADPVLACVLDPRATYTPPARPDPYLDLIESILSQQLSVKAAATIFGRLLDLFPRRRPTPARLAALSDAELRAVGVSRQKAGYLRHVAAFAATGGLRLSTLRRLDDEAVIRHLIPIKGVGRWTVEMLLMFTLGRPDVFPADDLGIQNAMKRLYGLRGHGPRLRRRMERIAARWRPHRTLACRHLWRSLR